MYKEKLLQDLVKSYDWLTRNKLVHDDYLLDSLPRPYLSIKGKQYVSFCSNNYLGLSHNPKVLDAAEKAVKKFSIGTCESRKLGGNLYLLEDLEKEIAKFKGTESSMIFATGLMANVGVISALTDVIFYMNLFHNWEEDDSQSVIMTDQLNHRSIQMGIKLSHAKVCKYNHSDMDQLEHLLHSNRDKKILIVTDGVFSMDGDLANLPKITTLAEKYQATVMTDDAHGSGVWGETGKGSAEHFGVEDKIQIKMGTLSKAFGAMGGFVAADEKIIKMLKVNTSTYYFTSSLPAEQAAGLIEATKIIHYESEDLRKQIWKNSYMFIKGCLDAGFNIPLQISQIIPVMIGKEDLCIKAEQSLMRKGVLVSSAMSPAVAPGTARLRATINATHTKADIEQLLSGLAYVHKKIGLPRINYTQTEIQNFENQIPTYIRNFIEN